MEKDDTKVLGEPDGTVVAEATPAPGEVAETTLTNAPKDAGEKVDYAEKLSQYEKDINNIKSAMQKREAQLQREFAERERLLVERLDELSTQTMTDEEKAAYQKRKESERFKGMEAELMTAKQQAEEIRATNEALQFFLAEGVPASELNVGEGYDALTESGWKWIKAELKRLRAATSKPETKKTDKKEAPDVVTKTGAPPSGGPTWEDLEKKYGSQEEVYRLVEQGLLDPTIIPL